MIWLVSLLGLLMAAVAALAIWRWIDIRADAAAWKSLSNNDAESVALFDPSMVAGLPEPAQRYFSFTIQPGTPLYSVVELDMTGQLGLGTKEAPNYQQMNAHQILAPPQGLVWRVETEALSGSDAVTPETSWTRFRLFGLVPVVRASGPDHHRSAFGRVIAEAAFWAPASLLPSETVRWGDVDENTARAFVRFNTFEQTVDITVDKAGAPVRVSIPRWSNENPEREFRVQPFGGELSYFRDFGGYRLPTRVEGGNHFGTPDYFPFGRADISDIRYPQSQRR